MSRLRIYLPMTIMLPIFIVGLSILAPSVQPGDAYIQLGGGLKLYGRPLFFAILSYTRVLAMLWGTVQYFLTNREQDTLVALRTLRVPFSVTYYIGLSLRSAGMFMDDLRIVREAERARGLDEENMTLRNRAKLYVMYMVPLFTLALRRAEVISQALYARGYTMASVLGRGGKRSDYISTKYSLHMLDYVLIAVMLALFVAAGLARHGLGLLSMAQDPLYHAFMTLFQE